MDWYTESLFKKAAIHRTQNEQHKTRKALHKKHKRCVMGSIFSRLFKNSYVSIQTGFQEKLFVDTALFYSWQKWNTLEHKKSLKNYQKGKKSQLKTEKRKFQLKFDDTVRIDISHTTLFEQIIIEKVQIWDHVLKNQKKSAHASTRIARSTWTTVFARSAWEKISNIGLYIKKRNRITHCNATMSKIPMTNCV